MKQLIFSFSLFLAVSIIFLGCNEPTNPIEKEKTDSNKELGKYSSLNSGKVIVADRASGTITVINSESDEVMGTYDLPSSPNSPEPMYVVFVRQNNQVFVGDRANNKVVVFDGEYFNVEASIEVGNGVFHMWADQIGNQLWVNNDIDNTTSVIDLKSLNVIATVPTPADLVAMGGKPHDVILDHLGRYAFVSVLGISGNSDYVVKFSTSSFNEMGRAAVGKDPHLSLTIKNNYLYVPCQNSDLVYLLDRTNMNVIKTISVPGSHGAGMATNGKVFYTTNLPGGGSNGLFAISTKTNAVIGSGSTPYPVPHNIALNTSSKKLYVTHSGGGSNKVTIYRVSNRFPSPQLLKEVTVGYNPFGIAFAN
jgi:YVTN family beta-propeller protein